MSGDEVYRKRKMFQTANVVVAVGRQGQPRLLDVPGADKSDKVTYRLHTAEDYQNKDILIVGGGNSAIEAALSCSRTITALP